MNRQPWSTRMVCRSPKSPRARCKASITVCAMAHLVTYMIGQIRLHVSTAVSARIRLPLKSSSYIHSIAHTWFGLVALLRSSRSLAMMRRRGVRTRALLTMPHLPAFQTIEPMHPPDVDQEPHSSQNDVNTPVAITRSCLCNLADTLAKGDLIGSFRMIMA